MASATRAREIQQLSQNYGLQKPGSQTALPLGQSLLKLLLEQAYYFDNIKAYGKIEKTDSNATAAYSAVASHAESLARQFPRATQVPEWKAEAAIARLRVNSPTGIKDALAVASKGDKIPSAARVRAMGIVIDRSKGANGSPFGSLEKALDLDVDNLTKSALKLLWADAKSNTKQAIPLYQEAARLALPFRGVNGESNPIVIHAVSRVVTLAISENPNAIDAEILSFLQSVGANDAGHFYTEQIALRTMGKQPRQAISHYQSIISQPEITPQKTLFIEHRNVEISLNANDCESADQQWERVTKLPNPMTPSGSDTRVVNTQNLCWKNIEKSPSNENVDRFVKLHDTFVTISPSYAKNENWTLKAIDALFRAKNDAASATRADSLVSSSANVSTQNTALRFAAKSRERILNLPSVPDFKISRKLENEGVSSAYVSTLDKLAKQGTAAEKTNSAFQAAYVIHISGNPANARSRFELALSTYSKHTLAADSASFLLEINLKNKDHAYTERIARHTEKLRIKPSNKLHADLRKIIENAVWEQASALAESSQFEAAGARFVAFQKEFSSAKRADLSLHLAAENYLKAQKVDTAITQMEKLLSAYPKSTYAKETRWNAAEQSKNIKQFQRSGTHYEQFNASWPGEGLTRKAMYKAGEMQRAASRYGHAVSNFEKYFSQTSSKPERVKTSKDIATLHMQFGKPADAIAAFDRVIKVSGSGDDEFWARLQLFELHLRQGQASAIRLSANKLLTLTPSGENGTRIQTRAKYELGKLDAADVRTIDPMRNPKLLQATKDLFKQYQSAKSGLLAPCEGALPEWCAVGHYEVSRLAEDVAKKLLDVETPPTLNPKEANQIQSFKFDNGEKLQQDIKQQAEQAETAIPGGVPDQDWAERIRDWAQAQRGENQTVEPMYK